MVLLPGIQLKKGRHSKIQFNKWTIFPFKFILVELNRQFPNFQIWLEFILQFLNFRIIRKLQFEQLFPLIETLYHFIAYFDLFLELCGLDGILFDF